MSVGPLSYLFPDGRSQSGVCTLEGVLDELSPPVLTALSAELAAAPQISFDLGGLKRINSLGVRAWCDFMKTLVGKAVAFRRCSPAFVDQLNTVSDFRAQGSVESFLAPYVCETTGKVVYEELVVGRDITSGDFSKLGPRPCAECPQPMIFDDVPERYLHFLTVG